jgi:hypothetical protein
VNSFYLKAEAGATVSDRNELYLMKSKNWSLVAIFAGIALTTSNVAVVASPDDKPGHHKGGKVVRVNPPGPGRATAVKKPGKEPVVVKRKPGRAVVKKPGEDPVVVRKRAPGYVRYRGPRTGFVIRTGPWVGLTLLAAPYYYDYRVFNRYPVEVAVQIELQREGYYDGPIDGVIGPATRNAISWYQRDYGLAVTGTINRATLRSLGIY